MAAAHSSNTESLLAACTLYKLKIFHFQLANGKKKIIFYKELIHIGNYRAKRSVLVRELPIDVYYEQIQLHIPETKHQYSISVVNQSSPTLFEYLYLG